MSTIAARCRTAADDRMERRRLRRLPALAGALVLAAGLTPLLAAEAAAQSRSGIYINNDVLNSLGPGPEAAPLAPLAPDAPPTPLSPRGQPSYQAPLVAPSEGAGTPGVQSFGNGSVVVTRPGTLLFPPLEAPDSTLAPGFAGAVDNRAARARALDDAFAEGPEPSSQLLIPLDRPGEGSDSVMVFMENLPDADPDADRSAAPVLVLQAPPQPAPPKPAVPAAALAALQPPAVEATELAPEFATEPRAVELEPAALEPAEPDAAEADADAMEDETPAPELVPELVPELAPELAEAPAAPSATQPDAGSAPVSLLPQTKTQTQPQATVPAPVEAPAPLEAATQLPAGVQTASLTVAPIEDRSFLFEVDSAELSPEAQSELQVLADALRGGDAGDIQVLGFASGRDSSEDEARKLALSRALKVRSFLIDAGISSARIRVRSLGDSTDGGPANRVDIKPIGS